ncbi:MAG: rod shape-determining protein RodA [Planctomycetes bacterium]|nr:rod shape-determining protein RodA [Planctomycetota bacterium]
MRRRKERFEEFDWHVLAVALVLSLIGCVFVWSTTIGQETGRFPLVARQVAYIGVSMPLIAVLVRVPYPSLARMSVPAYGIALLTLVALLVWGAARRETRGWVQLPLGFSLQPAEFTKLAVILMLAAYLRFRGPPTRWRDLVGPFVLAGIPMALIAKQPDLGGAITLVPVLIAMVLVAGAPIARLLSLFLIVAVVGVGFYYSPFIKDYQRGRIDAFFESIPEKTAEAQAYRAAGDHKNARKAEQELSVIKRQSNFQVYHAMISIGSGGLTGQKIGKGKHNRLGFLPERHNDFIFAVIGEEWGFVGSSIVLWLSYLLITLIFLIAGRTRDAFGRLLCVGVGTWLGAQTFINTGVATGLLPVTGLTLPFLSAGGSSMVASFLGVAVVLNVGAHRVTALDGYSFDRGGFAYGEPTGRRRR